MASEESSSGPEYGNDAILGDIQASSAILDAGIKDDTGDEYAFLQEELPFPGMASSDDDVYAPSSADADEDEDENSLPEDEDGHLPSTSIKREVAADSHVMGCIPPWPSSRGKRVAADGTLSDRPFKKARETPFNHSYLTLLNIDIEDAAAQYVPHDGAELSDSQIGLTEWTSVEKEIFFEALSRLGEDNVNGISRRVRTKGELEVRQYLKLLRDTASVQKADHRPLPSFPADFPAAVEVGPKCCAALEDAADAIASRQQNYEESVERKRWGEDWLITPSNFRDMEKAPHPGMPSLQLLKVSSWLRLPDRVFMNANFPENNWHHVSEDPPSIRATALEDFYSLAVSVTRRLVAATISVSESRIRAKRDTHSQHHSHNIVWTKDVEAAALSIGLKTNSKKFWAGCARRLRIDVYGDGIGDGDGDDDDEDDVAQSEDQDEEELMTYDAVEAALGGGDETVEVYKSADVDEELDDLVSLSDTPSLDDFSDPNEAPDDVATISNGGQPDEPEIEVDEEAVRTEAKELVLFTALEYAPNAKSRRAVESKIRGELQHVAYADAVDAKASQREEKRLWNMLGRDPPDDYDRVKVPGQPRRVLHRRLDDMCPASRNWRERLNYVPEWTKTLEYR